jgi:hypothetical protein
MTISMMILSALLTILFQDDFDEGNADYWYTVGSASFEVVSGRFHFSGGGADNDATAYRGDMGETMSVSDYSIAADVAIDVGTFGGVMVRYSQDGDYNLMLVLGLPQQALKLYRWHWSYIEELDSYPFAVEANVTYRVRFQCHGSTFAGKAWDPVNNEPDEWQVSAEDTLSRNGAAALFAAGVFGKTSGVYLSCYFDNTVAEASDPWSGGSATWAAIKASYQLQDR